MNGARGSTGARVLDDTRLEPTSEPGVKVVIGDGNVPIVQLDERRENLVVPALAGLAMFMLAVALLPASAGQGDSAEFTLALALAGVPHPTGYPLYVLFGHLFVKLFHAIGFSWAAAANAWSAAGAAVAVAMFTRLGLELVRATAGHDARLAGPAGRLAAVVPAILLALNPVWLIAATQAEVHSFWYALTAAAALYALIQIRRMDARSGPAESNERPRFGWRDPDTRAALGWGLLCGASFAHHVTSVLVLLPLTIVLAAVAWQTHRWRLSLLGTGVAGLLLPLAAYAHVAYRTFHPASYQWPIDPSWDGVWRHLSGSMYTRYFGGFEPKGMQLEMVREGVMPFLLALPLVGIWALCVPQRPVRRWLVAMLVAVGMLTGFVFRYGVPDPAAYFVPAMMLGYLVAIPAIIPMTRRWPAAICAALVLAVVVAAGSWSLNRAFAERERLRIVDARIRNGWNAIPFDEGFVLFLDDHCSRLEILRLLEHRRPGLHVINPNLLTWPAQRIEFARRFGFDPHDRVRSHYWAELPGILHEGTGLPVVDFRDVLEGRLRR